MVISKLQFESELKNMKIINDQFKIDDKSDLKYYEIKTDNP